MRTSGALQNLTARLESIHGGSMGDEGGGGLKTMFLKSRNILENISEGVHFLVKLLAISLQACNFTKNELLHTYFSRILASF